MRTNQIYIARDGKSGMHVLVRILAVDDIGKDYLPIDPDDFNKLMMARDVRSLVLAARDLGPMYISADILSRRIFIPSHLRQHIEHGVNLAPSDIESLLSECYFDPYALPVETDDMGYRAIGRTGKKSTRELIDELDFTKAGDLSYLDSQFRTIVEPLHDWIFARNLLSILMRIGGLYRSGADPDTILEVARFRQVNSMVLKKRFDMDTGTCYAIPIAFNPIYRMENLAVKDISFDALQFCPLYGSLIDKKNSFSRTAIERHLKGPGNEFVKFLAPLEASRVKNRLDNHESHSEESKWRYMVVSSNTDGEAINNQMQLANRLLQAFDGILFQPQLTYTGVKMAEIAPERKPRNILEAMWLLVRHHLDVDHITVVAFPVTGSRLLQKILGNRFIAVFIQNLTVYRQGLFNLAGVVIGSSLAMIDVSAPAGKSVENPGKFACVQFIQKCLPAKMENVRFVLPDCKPLPIRIVRNQAILLFDITDSLLSVLPAFGRAANRAIATSYARAARASRNILLLALDRCLEDMARHEDDLVIAYIDQANSNACNANIDTENEPARFGRKLLVRHQCRHDRFRMKSEITWIAVLHHRPSLSFSLMIRWFNNTTSRSFLVFPTASKQNPMR